MRKLSLWHSNSILNKELVDIEISWIFNSGYEISGKDLKIQQQKKENVLFEV